MLGSATPMMSTRLRTVSSAVVTESLRSSASLASGIVRVMTPSSSPGPSSGSTRSSRSSATPSTSGVAVATSSGLANLILSVSLPSRTTLTSTSFLVRKPASSSPATWSSFFCTASSTATEYSRCSPPWRSSPSWNLLWKVSVIQVGSLIASGAIAATEGSTMRTAVTINAARARALSLRKRRIVGACLPGAGG